MTRDTYGTYILTTGQGLVGQAELVMGKYFYETRFRGKSPILDLGPGRCWFTYQDPENIIGVDNSPALVDHYSSLGLHLRLGDAYSIPFDDGYFEATFCCWLFEHLESPGRALAEVYRVTKPGGYVCLIVPSPNDMQAFYDDYTHIRPFTGVSLSHLAGSTGFITRQVSYLYFGRGSRHILRLLGPDAVFSFIRFSDTWLRRFGIVNKNNLILEAWKP